MSVEDEPGTASGKSDRWFRAAAWFGALFVVSAITALMIAYAALDNAQHSYRTVPSPAPPADDYVLPAPEPTYSEEPSDLPLAVMISLAAFFVTGAGTASTVILGWRNERRQAEEFKLRIESLELQLTQARQQPGPSSSS